jgi:thiamine-phosphate pyrophosphorylase
MGRDKTSGKAGHNLRSFPETDIYGITCEKISRAGDNIEVVRQMLAAGIKIIQYREKEKTKKEKFRQCEIIGKMCKEAGALFIVNDDVDVALLTGAGGVHLGQSDLPADAVRRLAGPEMIIGVSVSSREEAGEARRRGADYLGVGPVFPTGTKPDSGEAIGLEGLADIALSTPLPVVAIGGINSENIALVFRKGAKCAAMISALVSADDIAAEVGKIRRCLSKA